jgi:hypothetical protein
MDSLNPEHPPIAIAPAPHHPRIWNFWGTLLWGLFVFAAMFVGQVAVIAYFVLLRDGPVDVAAAIHVVGGGLTISLSVIMGLPAVVLALWIAIRLSGTSFADYLALRWTSWRNFFIGVTALFALVAGWELLSRAVGREVAPGFMLDVLKSAQADGALWLLVIAFCVAAPMSVFSTAAGRNRAWGPLARSCCHRWPGPRCTCNMTGSFSEKYFRSACCSVICAIAPTRPGCRWSCTGSTISPPQSRAFGWLVQASFTPPAQWRSAW